jgi:hypothetical protein
LFCTVFVDESFDVFLGVRWTVVGLSLRVQVVEEGADALCAVGAEGLAEELAGGAALAGGKTLDLIGEVWREADGEGAGCACSWTQGIILHLGTM